MGWRFEPFLVKRNHPPAWNGTFFGAVGQLPADGQLRGARWLLLQYFQVVALPGFEIDRHRFRLVGVRPFAVRRAAGHLRDFCLLRRVASALSQSSETL